jgi:hypothetical protein
LCLRPFDRAAIRIPDQRPKIEDYFFCHCRMPQEVPALRKNVAKFRVGGGRS